MRYTQLYTTMTPDELKAARADAETKARLLARELCDAREREAALDLESFRRRHAERIDGAIAAIKADPALRAGLEWLRGDKQARAFGPRSYSLPDSWSAWRTITGRDNLRGDQSPSDRKLVEIVLALIPAGSA